MIARLRRQMAPMTTRIDALSLRERGILFVTLLAALFMFAHKFLFAGLLAERAQLERQNDARLHEIRAIHGQVERIVREAAQDPDAASRLRVTELRERLRAMEVSAADVTRGLVSPREMTKLVREMLARNRGLEVVKVENLPAEPLVPAVTPAPAKGEAGAKTATAPAPAANGVYRHGMRVTLRGRYVEIVRYLQSLEGLTWKVLWSEARLEAEESSPLSRITLTVYTLGIDRGWIGI